MLIRIPPYHERDSGKAQPKSIWEGIKLDPAEYDEYSEMEWEDDDNDEDGEDDEDEETGHGVEA
jgi:hypothetical protein